MDWMGIEEEREVVVEEAAELVIQTASMDTSRSSARGSDVGLRVRRSCGARPPTPRACTGTLRGRTRGTAHKRVALPPAGVLRHARLTRWWLPCFLGSLAFPPWTQPRLQLSHDHVDETAHSCWP